MDHKFFATMFSIALGAKFVNPARLSPQGMFMKTFVTI